MVPDKIIDRRGESQQTTHPWWWRDKGFVGDLGGLIVRHAAYCYELGRRYQIVKNGCDIKQYRSLPQILSSLQEKAGEVKFQLMHCFDLETLDPGILVDECDKKLSKIDLKKFNQEKSGTWVETNVIAWNLECSWERVGKMLKSHFKNQQYELSVMSHSQSKKIQEPYWQNLEVWDCFEAGVDLPERFSRDKNKDKNKDKEKKKENDNDHQQRVWVIMGIVKKICGTSRAVCQQVERIRLST